MINTWRIETFFDFSPAVPAIRSIPAGHFTLPATDAEIEFITEPFADSAFDRSITGRVRANNQGVRMMGTISWPYMAFSDYSNLKDDFIEMLNMGYDRDIEFIDGESNEAAVTTFTLAAATSAVGNYYTGMKIRNLLGEESRITAYNGGTKVFTVTPAFSYSIGDPLAIVVPAGVPAGFYLNNQSGTTGQIECILSDSSPIVATVDKRIQTKAYRISFMSRNLMQSAPGSWI